MALAENGLPRKRGAGEKVERVFLTEGLRMNTRRQVSRLRKADGNNNNGAKYEIEL